MKKIFYLLLLTAISLQAQTTGVNKLKIAANPEKLTATRVVVQDATTGDLGFILRPKEYTAMLNQTGTNAPVSSVLVNTLGSEIVWTRSSQGMYFGTSSIPLFNSSKTTILLSLGNSTQLVRYQALVISDTQIKIIAINSIGNTGDGLLNNSSIHIRIYN